jgi:hypothetical protein
MVKKLKVGLPGKVPRPRIPKAVRNALISGAILLLVLVVGGVAYTYYVGRAPVDTKADAVKPADATTSDYTIKPTQPAANARESAAVQLLTTPVAPGSNASISVKTNATSTCKISVTYNNVPSTDSGLTPKTANDFGTVDWSWTVGPNTPLGTWPVVVTCDYHGRTAVVQGDLEVAR